MRPAAAGWLSRAAPVSLDFCFVVSRRPLRDCEFSFGNFDTELLPFPKLGG
jgi:hypothetical protein